jgi:hypothetical protein
MASKRYHGLDVIRLAFFAAIAIFHISYIHYFTPAIRIAEESWLLGILEKYARSLSFSGFAILFLTSLLTAYSGQGLAKRTRLFTFLAFGWLAFSALMSGDFLLTWDIYPLISFGILISTVAETVAPSLSYFLGALGVALLTVPVWTLSRWITLSPDMAAILGFGPCPRGTVEWPILPWMGLLWMGYACGQLVRDIHQKGRLTALSISKKEFFVWGALLVGSLPQWGAFYKIRLGAHFICDAYRQPPLVWWSHMLWVFFFIRLSFDPRAENFLSSKRSIQAISNLAISRKFWVAYIASYLWAFLVSELGAATHWEDTNWRVEATTIVGILYFVSIEFVTRFFIYLGSIFLRFLAWIAKDSGRFEPNIQN